jgi:exodeoxyribonuclease V alpha subunit
MSLTPKNQPEFVSSNAGNRNAPESPSAKIRGEILRIVFASDDGQYTVARLLDTRGNEQTVVGALAGLLEGQDVEAEGKWENHKEHGKQFRISEFRTLLPSNENGIRRYLASGLIPGIGPKLAERIVDRFGLDTMNVLDNYPRRMQEIPGVGRKRVDQIRQSWKEHRAQRDTLVFLQGLGLTPAYCARVLQRYGSGAAEVVRRNPYSLASEVRGIGFLMADRIAGNLGVEHDSPLRLAAGILYTLDKLAEDGHTCFPRSMLLEQSAEVLGVDDKAVEVGLDRAKTEGGVIEVQAGKEEAVVYHRRLYAAEKGVAESLKVLLNAPGGLTDKPLRLNPKYLVKFNDKQQQAIAQALNSRASIITGGPGVGKTTVVGEIVRLVKRLRKRVYLAAPTGRAAKRLHESCGFPAKTIHRMLKWNPQERAFVHNEDCPLKCDMLILDEVSMMDIELTNQLLKAVAPGTSLVFVGDRDQLPSVGPGSVLHDLIASQKIPSINLTQVYRQEEGSRIVLNAHAVNRGEMPDLKSTNPQKLVDFYWIDQEEPERVVEVVARLVRERIPARFGYDPMSDVQVLTPMNRGSCGTETLNRELQSMLNPARQRAGDRDEMRFGERILRRGDRVMQVVNNYDKGVFNGELGRIRSVDRSQGKFVVSFDVGEVEYERHEADQVKLAYAVTIHKSQGSEFPVVIMPLLTQHFIMLQRNLVYTGMTRAKRLLIMVGTRKALAMAVRNDKPAFRYTCLAEFLRRG